MKLLLLIAQDLLLRTKCSSDGNSKSWLPWRFCKNVTSVFKNAWGCRACWCRLHSDWGEKNSGNSNDCARFGPDYSPFCTSKIFIQSYSDNQSEDLKQKFKKNKTFWKWFVDQTNHNLFVLKNCLHHTFSCLSYKVRMKRSLTWWSKSSVCYRTC